MKKSKDFVNRYITISLMLMLGVVTLFSFSCDRADENDIDRLFHPEEPTDAASSTTAEVDAPNSG